MTAGRLPQAYWRLLAELSLPAAERTHPAADRSAAGGAAMVVAIGATVAAGVLELDLPSARLERLQSAVAEAAATDAAEAAVQPGQPGTPAGGVRLRVLVAADSYAAKPPCPQSGWGFFIVEASGLANDGRVVEVYLYREGTTLAV
jgi:hypothetical protein